jgi:hypothetical protein
LSEPLKVYDLPTDSMRPATQEDINRMQAVIIELIAWRRSLRRVIAGTFHEDDINRLRSDPPPAG